ncbi:MAG: hypothetical protein V4503_12085 [Gemmatimonadota bacterium]
MVPRFVPLSLAAAALMSACDRPGGGSAACGISALTAPLVVLESFGKGNVLDQVPPDLPARLPVRFVAGAAVAGGLVADSAGKLRLTVTEHPEGAPAGYGVLVVDGRYQVQGAVVFEGTAVPGATRLGDLILPNLTLPLLGVRLDPRSIADPRCPLFPDSLR